MSTRTLYEKVVCKDGYTVSIQASETSYCAPRINDAEVYEAVELGFPSLPDEMIEEWAEDRHRQTETVYGWVPVKVVNLLIAKHGGVVSGSAPPGVILLSAV
jgi:hypothetical protein